MARLSSPCHTVHRHLRVPDLRTGDDSPLGTWFRPAVPGACHTRRLPTQRILPCGLSGTSRTRSKQCAAGSSMPSLHACHDAHAATLCPHGIRGSIVNDAVVLPCFQPQCCTATNWGDVPIFMLTYKSSEHYGAAGGELVR